MQPSKMTVDDLVSKSISLLQALTAAGGQRISRTTVQEELRVSNEQLDDLLDIVSDLCDRQTGARAIVESDQSTVALVGDAACLAPLRLNVGDAQVLGYVLDALNIDDATRARAEAAVCPSTTAPQSTLSLLESRRYGSFYQVLSEALADGVRCTIHYRAATDTEARERTVDPVALRDEAGSTYLDAWDVEQDAARRYRLDRISAVTLTDDSVETHPIPAGIGESLAQNAITATLAAKQLWYAKTLPWAGIQSVEPTSEGGAVVHVSVSRETWLFDEVLFSAGELVIKEPEGLRERFCAYARLLMLESSDEKHVEL